MQLWSLIGASWKSNISLNGLKSWHIGFSCIFVFCEHSSLANIVPSTMVMTPTIDVNDIISIKCKPAQIHYWHQWIRLWMKAFQSQREQKHEESQLGSFVWCVAVCRLLSLVENDSGLQYLHTVLALEFTLFIRTASFFWKTNKLVFTTCKHSTVDFELCD